jgi:hypothetical protein
MIVVLGRKMMPSNDQIQLSNAALIWGRTSHMGISTSRGATAAPIAKRQPHPSSRVSPS